MENSSLKIHLDSRIYIFLVINQFDEDEEKKRKEQKVNDCIVKV